MERQYLTLALLLLAVTISTSAVTTTKHGTLIISNADRSLTVDNYTIHGKTIVDNETKAIVKPKKNPDGSLTVEGKYTWYPNGTIVAPGVTIAVAGKASYVQIAKTKLFGIDGVARDATTNNVIPWIEDDAAKTFTAGDITGWSNGTFLGSNGVVLRTRLRFKPSNGTRGGGSTASPPPPKPAAMMRSVPLFFIVLDISAALVSHSFHFIPFPLSCFPVSAPFLSSQAAACPCP
ncbi:unnamed protein product [Closterium sp. NIES-65]|nr:unnamed protein product [Closterium sp. NIES-65]